MSYEHPFSLLFKARSHYIIYLVIKASVASSSCSRIWKIPGSSTLGVSTFTALSSYLEQQIWKNFKFAHWFGRMRHWLQWQKKKNQILTVHKNNKLTKLPGKYSCRNCNYNGFKFWRLIVNSHFPQLGFWDMASLSVRMTSGIHMYRRYTSLSVRHLNLKICIYVLEPMVCRWPIVPNLLHFGWNFPT